MATIETKFSIGDKVYHAGTTTTQKQHPCPDCLGSRKWAATSPAGGAYEFSCPRCASGYQSNRELSLAYTEFAPTTSLLTIGSVKTDTSREGGKVSYMCVETGVGSGSVYSEADLFATEDEAMIGATIKAATQNKEIGWVAKQYEASLKVCDYQLENAALKSFRDMKHSHSASLQNLFHDLRDCENITAVTETLDAFKLNDAD